MVGTSQETINLDAPELYVPSQLDDNVSPFGVQHMAGLCSEWTASAWSSSAFGRSILPDNCKTLEGPAPISIRGGGQTADRDDKFRCARRGSEPAMDGFFTRGFRCVFNFGTEH